MSKTSEQDCQCPKCGSWHVVDETRIHPEASKTQEAPKTAEEILAWAVERWNAEVSGRPMINRNRRPLDDAWRQMIRYLGGDEKTLLSLPPHDEILAGMPPREVEI